ncbi:phosphopantetheine-binding protein [Amycolatopsis rhabdoformis]|uniref:Phosphopantetheine-binding protein n=1 Tax=Amycolatopsis rhabdoformis TaxID=1448059 RepID=A0ABZ1I608_9PSEU|nr:phosphopantetheine-binding protein [Amycolatopsis rhabdoformis]WSE29664.1 phosphopantetheine-binding protein [Amycolatopsis rhabdoformis]
MTDAVISEKLREDVKQIISEVLEVEPAELSEDGSFENDYDADSLLVIEMFARFERSLGVKIPQDEMIELDTLPAAYALVARHSAGEPVSA